MDDLAVVTSPVPGPSNRTSPPSTQFSSGLEPIDSPCKKALKRKISHLHKLDVLKSHKIRRLQQENWRQKKKISSLKAIINELKKKNLMLGEHETIILDHFGDNKNIIERLFQKTEKKM